MIVLVGPFARFRTTIRSSRAPITLIAGSALVMILSGCVSIPNSGPVIPGAAIDGAPSGNGRQFASGPTPGDGPEALVRGFIAAAQDFADDHAVAREYFTSPSLPWIDNPVLIYTDPRIPAATVTTQDSPGGFGGERSSSLSTRLHAGSPPPPHEGQKARVTFTVSVDAEVDDVGHYTVHPVRPVQRRFDLVVLHGNWRISAPPEKGMLFPRDQFAGTFNALPVYFADPTDTWLVPDPRFFPTSGATASKLVAALLAGASPWLAPAVQTGFPEGTGLTVQTVAVSARVATVDLTSQVQKADPRARRRMLAQLTKTLESPRVGALIDQVTMTAVGAKYDIPDGPVDAAPDPNLLLNVSPSIDAHPVVIDSQNRLARLQSLRLSTAIPGLDRLGGAKVGSPAVNPAGSVFAVLTEHAGQLLVGAAGVEPKVMVRGTALVPPSFDPFDWVWTSPADNTGTLAASRLDGSQASVTAPWLSGDRVRSVRLSREGARVLVIAESGGQTWVYLSAVVRSKKGVPLSLTAPRVLLGGTVSAVSAAWIDDAQLVVLGSRGGGPQQVWNVKVWGDATSLTAPPGGLTITAGNTLEDLYVQTRTGVQARAGAGWTPVPKVRDPAMPG